MATVLITGGTGLIGKALSSALIQQGFEVIILTRKAKACSQAISYAVWNVDAQTIDTQAIALADYIIHLAGANVAEKRWTEKRKQEIVNSRVKSGALLVKALQETANKVKAVISASAIGWYGPDKNGSGAFVETDIYYPDFLGTTVKQWEESIKSLEDLHKRVVWLRTGIVLSNEGGAYAEFKKPLRFGLATILSNGRQTISWIHIDDLVRMYIEAIRNENLQGIYNAVAPVPVSNKELIEVMAHTRKKFYIAAHVPAFVLKAALGEMSIEILKSTTVSCNKIESTGFQFLYPTIKQAVESFEAKNIAK